MSVTTQQEELTKEDWLNRVYRKSNSTRSQRVAKSSLKVFELFCKNDGGDEEDMIKRYQELAKLGDIRSICLSLDRFVQFLDQDHPEIIFETLPGTEVSFKKKNPKTIKNYFSFIKSYLRVCHAVEISSEKIKDYVQFPKLRREPRQAISIENLKKICLAASPERRALYTTLISSGMRLGECLALTKKNFHFDENPVRVTIEAETTKTKEGRETYITSEAADNVKPLVDQKNDNEKIFSVSNDIDTAVNYAEHVFNDLRKKLGLLEKYPNSSRYLVNIHAFRAYFHTKASQKHGSDYANALDGHGAYLKQYYREDPKERAKKYKELEPSLLIISARPETEKTKDKLIESLQDQMKQLQDKMTRLELLKQNP